MLLLGYVDPAVVERIKGYTQLYSGNADDEDMYDSGQVGGALPVFAEFGYDQQGNGILGSIWRFVKPYIFSGAKAVAKAGLHSADGFLDDVTSGVNWREAGRNRLDEAGNTLVNKFKNKIYSNMKGSGLSTVQKRRLTEDIESYSEGPAAKIRKIIDEMKRQQDKRPGTLRKVFSILPPPEKAGRDLRVHKHLVKNKFGSARRASARIAQKKISKGRVGKRSKNKRRKSKKSKNQSGQGFAAWL
jgi:hypothetical protein